MRTQRFVYLGLTCLLTQAASAALITFSADADYDSNFREYGTGSTVSRNGTLGTLEKAGTTGGAVVAIYNTTATGGSAGSGGTGVATANNNTFSNFRLQMDFSADALFAGGNSIGFYTKVNGSDTTGYAGIFRLTGTGSADFRLFDSTGTSAAANTVGATVINSTTAFSGVGAGSFATGTFYTVRLDVEDIAGEVRFSASIFTQGGGTQIGDTMVVTDTTSPILGAGQVAIRMGTQGGASAGPNQFDNFSVDVIPEPGVALLSLAGLLPLAMVRSRK